MFGTERMCCQQALYGSLGLHRHLAVGSLLAALQRGHVLAGLHWKGPTVDWRKDLEVLGLLAAPV